MDDWVLDSLVGFLQSPMWTHPVNSFIENQCVVFDPGEENKFSYTDIHREYQKMVEDLLESFTSDIGITADQFTQACSQLQSSKVGQENEDLFEQVLAADDFLLFKTVMVQKNIDLELRALALMKTKMGHSPSVYDKNRQSEEGEPGTGGDQSLEEEDKLLEEALKLSERQHKLEQSMDEELQRMIEQAKAESLLLYQQSQKDGEGKGEAASSSELGDSQGPKTEATNALGGEEPRPVAEELPPEHKFEMRETAPAATKEMETVPQRRVSPIVRETQSLPSPPLVKSEPRASGDLTGAEAVAKWLDGAKSELESNRATPGRTAVHSSTSGPTPEELKAREQYLRRQRDRLLDMKRSQRAQESRAYTTSLGGSTRSKSAQVAREAVAEGKTKPQSAGSERDAKHGHDTGAGKERDTKHGRDTGVLSSAIAGNLKRELKQKSNS